MCYLILTDDTQTVIPRSRIKLAEFEPNLRLDGNDNDNDDDDNNDWIDVADAGGAPTDPDVRPTEPTDPYVRPTEHHPGGTASNNINNNNNNDDDDDEDVPNPIVRGVVADRRMAIIDANDLIGRTFLNEPEEDGTRHRMKIIERLDQHDADIANDPSMIRFRATNDHDTVEEIVTYRQILDKLEGEDGDDGEWHFKAIDDHQGPLSSSNPNYKGSRWNVRLLWENGETTWEPLSTIRSSHACNLRKRVWIAGARRMETVHTFGKQTNKTVATGEPGEIAIFSMPTIIQVWDPSTKES
jgi:hypothetical protein